MRVTICQIPNHPEAMVRELGALLEHVGSHSSDLLILPEMPFAPWLYAEPTRSEAAWQSAVEAHQRWLSELVAMAPTSVVVSMPVSDGGVAYNRAIAVGDGGSRAVHDKYYLPNETGYWEANWYQRGSGQFDSFDLAGARVGVLLCTEMWFPHRGRAYGKQGAELIAVPRATPAASVESWMTGGRSLALISGCYVLSSNLAAPHAESADLGGVGFACDPQGRVMATTSASAPFATVDVDLAVARTAKSQYPRYVADEWDLQP